MISQKEIRVLLRKAENKFISKNMASQILKLDGKKTIETLTYLETQGFIEKVGNIQLWQQSFKGKLLSNKRFTQEFKVDTLRKHLKELIERIEIINSSKQYPDYVAYIKITSEYPIENRSDGIHVAYSLNRKKITNKEYRSASNKLRQQYSGTLGNIVEYHSYPHEAIRAFLKSGSHVLKLRKYEKDEIVQIEGYSLVG
ncbi:hypothetical protein [Chitinophaga sp. MM2321]|uniref:hypothetical protein n=1 Tax=Chitinophaga sp. MM2321 TaxID=3137178 RepID=UPI0032D580F0